jgi:PHP family Zn ribbon phosphoesterase
MSNKCQDLPVKELVERAKIWIDNGWVVYFKWTCEKCGSRQTFEEPNTIFKYGKCEECGYITEIKKGGFTVVKLF